MIESICLRRHCKKIAKNEYDIWIGIGLAMGYWNVFDLFDLNVFGDRKPEARSLNAPLYVVICRRGVLLTDMLHKT